MKINPILQKFESNYLLSKSKNLFAKNVSKGDIVSIIYYDFEKEQVRVQQFTGVCRSFKSAGLNSKLSVYNVVGKIAVQQQFFLYSKVIADVSIIRKKMRGR
jgi:ribosomal protein L19